MNAAAPGGSVGAAADVSPFTKKCDCVGDIGLPSLGDRRFL